MNIFMKQNDTLFRRINWEDGMNIRAKDLIMTENFLMQNIFMAKQAFLPSLGYGLIPETQSDGREQGTDVEVYHTVTDKVEILVTRCLGITPSGYVVNYNSCNSEGLSLVIPAETIRKDSVGNTNRWNILLNVFPYERVLSGTPDNSSMPPRYPYIEPEYTLSLSSIGDRRISPFSLIVGRIRMEGERFMLDYAYIPPCTNLSAHSELIHYYRYFGQMFNAIEKSSKDIVNKVMNRSDSSPIAINMAGLCKDILQYIAVCYFDYRNFGAYWHPGKLIGCYSSLAHICLNALSYLEKNEKEDLMQYFYEWSDINPGVFESLLNDAIDIEYNHLDMQSAFFSIENFLKAWSELWQMLSSLDYIGRHKENIVIGERNHLSEKNISSEWTPFDRV